MKYIVLPLLRVFYLLLCFLFMIPVCIIFYSLWSLWEWKIQPLKDLYFDLTHDFYTQDSIEQFNNRDQDSYYKYKTPWDFLTKKKTWIKKSLNLYK